MPAPLRAHTRYATRRQMPLPMPLRFDADVFLHDDARTPYFTRDMMPEHGCAARYAKARETP